VPKRSVRAPAETAWLSRSSAARWARNGHGEQRRHRIDDSPSPTTGTDSVLRSSPKPASWKWPTATPSTPPRSRSIAAATACNAHRSSVKQVDVVVASMIPLNTNSKSASAISFRYRTNRSTYGLFATGSVNPCHAIRGI
jgi:hypothetical protein